MAIRHTCDRCGEDCTHDYAQRDLQWVRRQRTITSGPAKESYDLCAACDELVRRALRDALDARDE